jgi:hypothetical protein
LSLEITHTDENFACFFSSFHFAFARSLHFLVAVSYFSFSIDCRNIIFITEKKPEESMMGEANGHGDNNLACVDMSSPDLTTTAARLRQASFLPSSNYLLSFKEKKNWILVFLCCEFLGFELLNPPEACPDCAFPPLLKSRNPRFSFLEGVCVCVCGTGICSVCASLRERRRCFFAHVCIWEVGLPPVLKRHGFHRIPVSKVF